MKNGRFGAVEIQSKELGLEISNQSSVIGLFTYFTARKYACAKVMFSQTFVCSQRGGGGSR